MSVVSMKQLLEAGVHFGHATKRWNPKMGKYIYTARNGIHIIDLKLTAEEIEKSYKLVFDVVSDGGKVLFVGTKKQAQEAVYEEAIRTGHFYVNQRWLGGTLTNFKTIRRRIRRLKDLFEMEEKGTFELLPKKEVVGLIKERDRLEKFLTGIIAMERIPDVVFIVDPRKEINAIREARKLNIPVIGIVDTNCDPDEVDYVIPANDDAMRAVKLITHIIGNAIIEAQGGVVEKYEDDEVVDLEDSNKDETTKKEVITGYHTHEKELVEEAKELTVEVKEHVIEVKEEKVTEKIDYNNFKVAELREMAKEKNIDKYSTLRKAELVEALENYEGDN